MKTLRLILGDQLNAKHSWFRETHPDVVYLMAEMRQETDYTLHHIQKVVGFFRAMRGFAEWLKASGHHVIYYRINDVKNPQALEPMLQDLVAGHCFSKFEYQLPDEYRLDQLLMAITSRLAIPSEAVDTEHFFTTRTELGEFFRGKKTFLMERFYRHLREKHGILMAGPNPEGGRWNFDHDNRNPYKGEVPIPDAKRWRHDVSDLLADINSAQVKTFGHIDEKSFDWPTTRAEALETLKYFCLHLLEHFGKYQDAMTTQDKFLFHSRLSFAMNIKLISPKEVIATVLNFYRKHPEVALHEVEGFVRQIVGWREYMRGMYWLRMPEFAGENTLGHHGKLPKYFWDADTKMNCLRHAIGQSLDDAYAHHIQRLMVIGNFALLAQTHPDDVDAWYLGVYIDALEWVEMPNTRGMSQWADGGVIATKPYVASGNYINKMSNYCKDCRYDVKQRIGEHACPFNSLYWNFLDTHREKFKDNQRMTMMLALLDKIKAPELSLIREKARHLSLHIDDL